MKRWALAVFALAFLIHLVSALKIPNFLLEARHPWIKAREPLLKLVDAKGALCSPNYATAKLLGPLPGDLFETLTFDTSRFNRLSRWSDLEPMALDVLDCPNALQQCRNVYIDIYTSDSSLSCQNFSELMMEAFSQMENLDTIEWRGCSNQRLLSGSANNATIPSVKHLILEPNKHFLLKHTPNVETLFSDGGWRTNRNNRTAAIIELANTVKELPKLANLSIHAEWSPDLVESVLSSAPQIQNLTMDGSIRFGKPERHWSQNRDYLDAPKLKIIAAKLREFPNLKFLKIPFSEDLKTAEVLEYPMCGNAVDGAGGRQFNRKYERARIWAVETIAKIILEQLPHLQSLTVDMATASNIEQGVASWPWTGRMREYLWERYPLFKRGEGINDNEPEAPGGKLFGSLADEDELLREDWKPTR